MRRLPIFLFAILLLLPLFFFVVVPQLTATGDGGSADEAMAEGDAGSESGAPESGETAVATFAGGCFWCMEPPFDKLDGVISTTSGYIGGEKEDPTYQEVSAGKTGHAEAVQVKYDPTRISYEKLLEVFWHNIDPTVKDRQFCDWGSQYRTGIFYHDEDQHQAALASLEELRKNKPFPEPIVTEIVPAGPFYPAEEYHQNFYKKSPVRYKTYRAGCGRDARLHELWGEQKG